MGKHEKFVIAAGITGVAEKTTADRRGRSLTGRE